MTIVILAAGVARRMGQQKLLLPIEGEPLIERVVRAAAAWPLVVVTGAEVAPFLAARTLAGTFRVVRNAAPERGMSHSLALANAVIDPAEPIAVLLGDLPDITSAAIAAVLAAYDDTVDVVVPHCGERPAHPVIFGPPARRKIAALAAGDTIKLLRDDPSLRRRRVETAAGGLVDIDTPYDYFRRTGTGSPRSVDGRE